MFSKNLKYEGMRMSTQIDLTNVYVMTFGRHKNGLVFDKYNKGVPRSLGQFYIVITYEKHLSQKNAPKRTGTPRTLGQLYICMTFETN